jgi:hypothetical protein
MLSLSIAIALVGCDDDGDDGSSTDETPSATAPAGVNGEESPMPGGSPVPDSTTAPGDFATITLDTDSSTPGVEHDDVSSTVGETFVVAVNINDPPEPYVGYEFGITWDDAVLQFVSDERIDIEGLSLCPVIAELDFRVGIYGGCLSATQSTTEFEGPVRLITFECAGAGESNVRMLGLAEARSLGTALQPAFGVQIATELDPGITVRCE